MTQPPDDAMPPQEPQPPTGDPYAAPPAAGQPSAPPAAPPYGQPYAPAYGQPYAMPAAPGMYIDPVSGVQLPEGVQLASVGRRIGAWFLAIPLSIVTLGIGYLIWGLIVWRNGQTPALQVLGMRCWRPETHSVPGFWRMALREIIGRFVDGVLYLITLVISFVMFASSRDHKSLHDHVAGTVVVHDPEQLLARQP